MFKKYSQFFSIFVLIVILSQSGFAQDSVDVTFRYVYSGGTPYLVGEFNGWNNSAWPMSYGGNNLWTRTTRLQNGTYQYKFYYTDASPWPNDPLNHHVNGADNANSILYVKNPVIYHFIPNQRTGFEQVSSPTISAYLYPKVGTVVDTASIQLKIDDTSFSNLGKHYNFGTKQFVFPVPLTLSDGNHTARLIVGENADSVTFIIQAQNIQYRNLPEYAKNGVTLPSVASNDSTTFRLRVSGVSSVVLNIAAGGQDPLTGDAYIMHKDPLTDDWWLNLDLPSGSYEYKYQTDTGEAVYDPWGRWNGENGSFFTIGNAGLTADDYEWKTTDFVRPDLNRLVIYEVHIGEFAGGYLGLGPGGAGFSDFAQLMSYFDSLGINAIELMPVTDYGTVGASGHSWGYDLNSYFALEPQYGTPYEFKALVDSAHAHGIAVILDVVYNHLNETSPLWQMQPDITLNPYFKLNSDLRYNEDGLAFFRDMDHWTDETQELIYSVLKMWIDEYKIDGFRYDYTQGIGWNINEPDKGILGWANKIDTEYNGAIYQIAEHLPESPALIYRSGLTGGWHDSFRDEIFDEARFKNTSLTSFENLVLDLGAYPGNDTPSTPSRYSNRSEPVNATVTHDEQSLIYEMTTFQGVSLADAIQRDKLYVTLMFTSLGIPMVWQGMEFSESRGWHDDNEKLSYRPLQWSMLETERGQSHFKYYKTLIKQRLHNPALFRGELKKLYRYESEKILVWGFQDTLSQNKVMLALNFKDIEQTVTNVPWLEKGKWFNAFTGENFIADSTVLASLTVPGYSALMFTNTEDSILLGIEKQPQTGIASYKLYQNYPNPFNPQTTITYQIARTGNVNVSIYNIKGQLVKSLVSEKQSPGYYSITFNASDLASGMYFYTITTGNFIQSKKMLLIK